HLPGLLQREVGGAGGEVERGRVAEGLAQVVGDGHGDGPPGFVSAEGSHVVRGGWPAPWSGSAGRPPRTLVTAAGRTAPAYHGIAVLGGHRAVTRVGGLVLGAAEPVLLAEGLVDLEQHLLLTLGQRGVGEQRGPCLHLVLAALGVEDAGPD